MTQVDSDIFLELFSKVQISESDEITYQSFLDQCSKAEIFLLLADNCGEIVLDKLLVEQLKERFPELKVAVMVRGGEVLNDATKEDAVYVGMDQVAEVGFQWKTGYRERCMNCFLKKQRNCWTMRM